MKITILFSLWLAALPAAALAADAPAAVQGQASFGTAIDQVDAIDRETLDLNAAYWAWDIKNGGRGNYADLKAKGQNWLMKPETRDLLFAKIKEILDSGKVRTLTAEELNRLEDARQRIQKVLSPGRGDEKLIASLTTEYCVDLNARYWGRRVRAGEKEVLGYVDNWVYTRQVRAALKSAIEKYAAQETPALTKEEAYKKAACGEKLSRDYDTQRAELRAKTGGLLKGKLELIDTVQRETLKEDAMYWAWRAEVVRDTSFSELQALSQRWIMMPDTRTELFRLMEENIKAGKVRALTPEEKARHDAGKARVRAILAGK
ncbi:MAG TPA: hypothetical protein PKI19_04550 [Elusimicrobiales bacterium]|nr:hypothetical protein [Elusimicrobiales bacterium]